jgi:tetratricopeptide (TPR) repeat protein
MRGGEKVSSEVSLPGGESSGAADCETIGGSIGRIAGNCFMTRFDKFFVVALVATLALVYGRVLSYGFVDWDDDVFITGNRLLTEPNLRSLLSIFQPGGVDRETIFVPVTYFSFWIEAAVFGLHPAILHATNLTLHCLSSLLVYLPLAAAVAAFIFALHPLQVESVAWTMGRKSLLGGLFALITAHAWLTAYRAKSRRWCVLACFVMAFGCLSHPAVLTFPLIAALLVWVDDRQFDRFAWSGGVAMATVSVAVFLVNQGIAPDKFEQRPMTIVESFVYSMALLDGWVLRLMLIDPPRLFYPMAEALHPSSLHPGVVVTVGAVIVLMLWPLRYSIRQPTFGVAAWVCMFSPALYLLFTARTPFVTADRYGYFGMAFLVLAVVPVRSRKMLAWLLVIAGIAGGLAAQQSRYWQSPFAFWNRAVLEHPDYVPANEKLAGLDYRAGRVEAAYSRYLHAAAMNPSNSARANYRAGVIAAQSGDGDLAKRLLRRALLVDGSQGNAAAALASLYLQDGDSDAAKQVCDALLARDPHHPGTAYNRGLIHYEANRIELAFVDFETAVDGNPAHVEARFKLAMCALRQNRVNDGVFHLERVVALEPDHKTAWHNLAGIYAASGMPGKAAEAAAKAKD